MIAPGTLFANRFRIGEEAGRGGTAVVYRAIDEDSGATVALKLLLQHDEVFLERFAREALALAELRHPRILRYVSHGQSDEGVPYLVTEWLDGEPLSKRLGRGRLGIEEAIEAIIRVAEALRFAHRHGIVHRDLKPANLFLVGGELARIKLLDFGVALLRTKATRRLTGGGGVVGTPNYMSPEQARGSQDIGPGADVYSLGAVLFRCVGGRAPFVGNDVMSILMKVVVDEAPRLSDFAPEVSPALDDLVARMLAKFPDQRPKDADAVLEQLSAIQQAKPSADETQRRVVTTSERRAIGLLVARVRPGSAIAASDAGLADFEVRACASRHGGRLDVLVDGSLVVAFTGGTASDQAAHAARCALALKPLLGEIDLALTVGRSEGAALLPTGDAIDRAVDLLSKGGKQIRLDDAIAGLLDVRFDIGGDEGGLLLRGERAVDQAPRTLLGVPTTCVGRDRELGALDQLLDEAIDGPVARCVIVVGAAGMGKSRLRSELVRRMSLRAHPVESWVGRGDPMTAQSPFGALAPALRRAAGLRDGEPLAVRRQKLRARVSRHFPGGERDDASRITAFLGEMIGASFDDEESLQLRVARDDTRLMGDQMRRAFIEFLDAETRDRPIVLFVEDLHWADVPSVSFLDAALGALAKRPLLVVGFARPEIHETFPRLWSERGVVEIALSELSAHAGEQLVREALGKQADPRLVTSLVERSSGNALFLEELVRAAASGKGDELPLTLVSMVEGRIEALDPAARQVLRAASVFGERFWKRGVVRLLGDARTPIEVSDWIDELVHQELVVPRTSRFLGEQEYAFRHALTREAAYAMLPGDDRENAHRVAAEWLREVGENDAMVLAIHFHRGGLREQAVSWYRTAAAAALDANDLAATVDRVQQAIACGASGHMLGVLQRILTEAYLWSGEFEQVETSGLAAMQLLQRGTPLWYAAVSDFVSASTALGKPDRLNAVVDDLLALAPVGRKDAAYVKAALRVAVRLFYAGKIDKANELLDRTAEAATVFAAKSPAVAALRHGALAIRALFAGALWEHLVLRREAAASFAAVGDLRNACAQNIGVGHAYVELGGYEEAIPIFIEAIQTAEHVGLRNLAALARHNLGMALARSGAIDDGLVQENAAVEAFHQQGDLRMTCGSRLYVTAIQVLAGRFATAVKSAQQGCELARSMPAIHAYFLGLLSRASLPLGRVAEALSAAEEGERLLAVQGRLEEGEVIIRLARAEALHASGRVDEALLAVRAVRDAVVQRAAKIGNDEWQRSYLDRVEENRRALQLVVEWGAAGPR